MDQQCLDRVDVGFLHARGCRGRERDAAGLGGRLDEFQIFKNRFLSLVYKIWIRRKKIVGMFGSSGL